MHLNNLIFREISYPIGWEMRKDTAAYQLNFHPPGVEVHCLYGANVDTVERLTNHLLIVLLNGFIMHFFI